MRQYETMVTYTCDCCGERLKDSNDFIGLLELDIWDETDHEWIEKEGKHYCPNCYSIDYDDNIVIKTK